MGKRVGMLVQITREKITWRFTENLGWGIFFLIYGESVMSYGRSRITL